MWRTRERCVSMRLLCKCTCVHVYCMCIVCVCITYVYVCVRVYKCLLLSFLVCWCWGDEGGLLLLLTSTTMKTGREAVFYYLDLQSVYQFPILAERGPPFPVCHWSLRPPSLSFSPSLGPPAVLMRVTLQMSLHSRRCRCAIKCARGRCRAILRAHSQWWRNTFRARLSRRHRSPFAYNASGSLKW